MLAAACSPAAPSSEVIVASVSAVIALLALGSSFYFGWLQRNHFRLSSRPILDFEVGCVDEILGLGNHGVGPALIDKMTATIDDEEIDLLSADGLDQFATRLLIGSPLPFPDLRSRGLLEGSVVAANTAIRMIYSETVMSQQHRDRIKQNYQRARLHIEYKSIYSESFILSHKGFA